MTISYHLYLDDTRIYNSFDTCDAAVSFGKLHKQICLGCANKIIRVEKVVTTVQNTLVFDESEEDHEYGC